MAEDNFESESRGGQRWKHSRRATNEGGKTLQKSGQLTASLITQVCSNKKYAAIHHLSGTVKTKNKPYLLFKVGEGFRRVKQVNIPAHPYLPINGNNQLQPDAERRIPDIAITALKKGL